jgi:hypothetical protein
MVRIAKKTKIHDEQYLAMAIDRIALDLTRNIVEVERERR